MIMLKIVVFPAPLGPMSPTSSPLWMSMEKSFTATRPPNFMVRFCMERITSFPLMPSSFGKAPESSPT